MATRLGVDVGGTFTDLIFYDAERGELSVGKELTTPAAPEEGVLAAITAAVPAGRLAAATYFLHGTTVGLNSLLTRTGATVGLLATRGFRDVLEMARGDRADPYNLFWRQPAPLVPRHLRLPVSERIRADGGVFSPFAEDDVREALATFRQAGVDSIAVAFMNAYANPAHELAAEQALRRAGFDGAISLSHQVSGEYREFERTSTTVLDAYVRPRMMQYLRALDGRLRDAGFAGSALVTRSGGGAMTFGAAEERPFETIMSGPVAGAEGASELACEIGMDDVITANVGGTSFDTCLVSGGRAQLMYEGSIEGLPVQTPWVDVRSIGAGGGSIASVDIGGLLRVGPASAGAAPGPACYGRGGTRPTVTDAALLLGMLGEGRLASGLVLDRNAAATAIEPIATQLGFTAEQAACGVMTIVAATMAGAIREITIERGRDPRTATLMPFGGAGPLFATLLAAELELHEIVVPANAGSFSAWGLLGADLTQSGAQTRIMRLDDDALAESAAIFAELYAPLETRGGADDDSDREHRLDLRYVGQEHTLTIAVPGHDRVDASAAQVRATFEQEYEVTFGHSLDQEVEIVSWRAMVRTALARRATDGPARHGAGGEPGPRSVDAWSFTQGQRLPFAIVDRDGIGPDGLQGPAVVLEQTATTYVDAGFRASRGEAGVLYLTDGSVSR
jgi:N-methylhydantoinase A